VNATISAPVGLIEAMGNLRFSAKTDHRLQELMHRHTAGNLQSFEKEELEAWAELSKLLSVLHGEALQVLGRQP
jgi:hypothetical protein